MIARLWEWGVTQAERDRPVGVCMSRDGAIAALAGALVTAGKPGHGSVRPVALINGAYSDAHYLRLPVVRTAVYEQGVIRWEFPPVKMRQAA